MVESSGSSQSQERGIPLKIIRRVGEEPTILTLTSFFLEINISPHLIIAVGDVEVLLLEQTTPEMVKIVLMLSFHLLLGQCFLRID